MSFVEIDHPRGQAANAGQFRDKSNSAPIDGLEETTDAPDFDQWRILADRLPDLAASIDKANRRLARANVEERFTFEATEKLWYDEQHRPWLVADVTINRPAITVGPWRFVGAHAKTAAGAMISHYAGNAERVIPDESMRCDHCGQFRSRQKVYTVQDSETGETKQIGSGCLALFLGVKPEGLWAMAAEVGDHELRFDADEFGITDKTPNAFDGDELLLATIRQIDQDGEWISRGNAGMYRTPTIDKVKGAFATLTASAPTVAEQNEVTAIVTWLDELEPEADDDYLRNLKAAFTRGEGQYAAVHTKHAALAASAVSSHRRHLERQRVTVARQKVEAKKKPEFLFEKGESLKGKDLELTVLGMREGYDYGHGAPTHVTLMDDDGHVFYWKASGTPGASVSLSDGAGYTFVPDEGSRVRITGGSVKEHKVSEYNGDHETVIWRVKVAPIQAQVDQWEAEHAADVAELNARRATAPVLENV